MPTVRLDIEIDGDVYPELHAALCSLKSTRARGERMRQLASAGLVWEKARLQGDAAASVPAPPAGMGTPPPAPSRATADRRRPRPTREEVAQVIRELPVLMDVVADVRPLPVPEPPHAPEEPAAWAAMNPFPDDLPAPQDAPDSAHDDDLSSELPDAAMHVAALSHKPATRTRLLRMKERGLFKNG